MWFRLKIKGCQKEQPFVKGSFMKKKALASLWF
jgi:hypothetical protein